MTPKVHSILATPRTREAFDIILQSLYENGGLRLDSLIVNGEKVAIKHLTDADKDKYKITWKNGGLYADPIS